MARDSKAEFLEQLEAQSPKIAKAFREAIEDIRSVADERRLAEAIENGEVELILDLLNLSIEFFAPVDDAIRNVFNFAGVFQMAVLPLRLPDGEQLVVRFDQRTPRAEDYARTHAARLVTEVQDDTRATIQEVITRGASTSTPPRVLARQLVGKIGPSGRREGGLVGLTSIQAQYVLNFRDDLLSAHLGNNARYFDRVRRDRRFDSIVKKAAANGTPIPPDQVERMVARYSDRLLALRGETIGRTEALEALNAGKYEAALQLIERGEVPEAAVEKEWRSTPSIRTRDTHIALNNQRRPIGEPFLSPSGFYMQHPGDSSLGAPGKERINCRCSAHTMIDWVAVADWRESMGGRIG